MGCRGSAATSGNCGDNAQSIKQALHSNTGTSGKQGSAHISDDQRFETGETFVEMWNLAIVSCQETVTHWEERLVSAWQALEKALRTLKGSDGDLKAAVNECSAAVASRESKRLASVLTKVSKRTGPSVDIAGRVLKYNTREVVLCEEILRVRQAMLEAVLYQDALKLCELISRAKALGDTCLLEQEYAAELQARGKCEDSPRLHDKLALAEASQPALGNSTPEAARDVALQVLDLEQGRMPPVEDLRAAFRKAALRWHPDRPQNHGAAASKASERFREARDAYNLLLATAAASAAAKQQQQGTVGPPAGKSKNFV